MKIVKIGDLHRLLYVAKNQTTGLTNVTGKAISPSKAVTNIPWSGTDPSAGFCELGQGIYYYDWDSTGKAAGAWAFVSDSASKAAFGADAILVVDGDTLNDTPFEKLDTMLDSVLSALNDASTGLAAISGDVAAVASDVGAVKTLAEGTSGFVATKSVVDAIQTAVGLISNSTKNTWVTPSEVVVPDSGSVVRRIFMNIFDGSGNMEDPDSNQIQVQIYNEAGSEVSADFLSGSAPFYMTRDAAGQYHIDYTVESTDAEQALRFKQTYVEGGLTVVRDGVVSLVAALSSDISSRFDAVDAAIEAVQGTGFSESTDSLAALRAALDGYLGEGGTVESFVDEIETLLKNGTYGLSAMQTIISAVQTIVNNLPDSGALTSLAQASVLGTPVGASIAADIAAVQTGVDDVQASLAPGGYMI